MLKSRHNAQFVDSEEGSITIRLKVSPVEKLENLVEDTKSGKLLENFKTIYCNTISQHENEQFFQDYKMIDIWCDEVELDTASQQLSRTGK